MAKIEETSINLRFFYSLLDSNISEMKKMLVCGANINFIKDRRSGLMIAAERGDKIVVKFLIEKGADIDLKDYAGESALMRAIYCRNVEVVNLLLKHGAEPNQTDNEGLPALACACNSLLSVDKETESRQLSIVKLLLKHGSQIDLQDRDGASPLMFAVQQNYGYGLIATFLLKYGVNVNLQDKSGKSVLMSVAESENSHLIKQLFRYGAQVDLQDKDGQSALMLVSKEAHQYAYIEVTSLLIKHGANVNLQDFKGNSALILNAVAKESFEFMTLLLKHGAQVNMQNNDGRSVLTFVYRGESTVQLLLDHGAQVDLQDNDGLSALMHICKRENYYYNGESAAHALLEGGAQVNLQSENGWSALMFATQASWHDCVRLLLEHEADVGLQDENGKSSLMIAIENNTFLGSSLEDTHLEVAEILIGNGAQVNLQDKMGRSALMQIYLGDIKYGCIEVFLLENGADVNLLDIEGKSALILACQNKAIREVKTILSWGAYIELQDKEGWSALMWAAAGENKETLKLKQLVEKKVAMNLRNSEGRTALMIASWDGNTEAVEVLLDGGAAIDSGDNDGKSALVHASRHGLIDVAELLLKHGAHLDWQDNEGCTPLMVACYNRHKEMASFLINSGASLYLKNNDGKTAYDLALENHYTDILELFTKIRINSLFPGILFSEDIKKMSITSSTKDINLEDVGISLSIPEDALPSTDPPLEVQILPCFSGSWEVPENLELVSPAYIVEPSREVVFRKEVLVKIWHHANLETEEDCEDMVFLSASTTPEYRDGSPVYVFQEITGVKGSFRPREKLPVGEIALKHFCILGIFRYFFRSHLYSARLYTARERKAVIFCMCLSQPQYIKCCDEEMAALYKIQEAARDLVVKDGVTITGEEVCVKQNCPKEWKTLCKNDPASILKNAIGIHTRYEPGDCNFPKIEIAIKNVPKSQDSEPLELRVEGLNVESVFRFPPEEFLTFEVDTTKIKSAMVELGDEIKGQSLECSGGNNILSIATQMLQHMECIVKLLQSQDPHSVSDSVLCMLQDMDGKSRWLRDEAKNTQASLKVTYAMETHVEDVSLYSRQLKVIYSANIHHSFGSGNTSECHAATSLFFTNAANLMSSIRDVLKASKSAQSLPNNRLDTTPQPHPLPSASSQTKHSLHTQATPRQHICREYFGREAPTIEDLCIAVIDHPTDKRFNLSNHISDSWKTIGLTLGMELGLLDSIGRNRYDDAERLMTVFSRWLENAAGLPHHARYPLSWQGLNTLLEDIGKTEVAKQYFEFLDDLQSN